MLPLCPILVFLALPFARRDTPDIFPAWLQWLNTWDDFGPSQGMYEQAVADVYAKYGWHVKTWYWLGIRNQCYSLFWSLAPQIQFYSGAVWDRVGNKITVSNAGRTYWQYDIPVGSKVIRIGWKLFAIERFFTGDKSGNPYLDRPTFLLQLRSRK
jgi:hypothetical protein